MRVELETRRRLILPLLAGLLFAGYLFAFLPLSRKAASLDAPLDQAWRKLAGAMGQSNALRLDFFSITNQFRETRSALTAFEQARQEARRRAELDDTLRARLAAPFQLVDYDNEAGRLMGALARLARQKNVALEPPAFAGWPVQTADMKEPALLWAELAFIESLFTTALNAQVTTIHSVTAPSPLTNAPPTNGVRSLVELPVQFEFTGTAASVGKFLQTVPLRAAEIAAAGLPESPTNKPALFIDRLVVRKQSPEKPDELRVSLRALGFVFRE
jgi:hypothetical protein